MKLVTLIITGGIALTMAVVQQYALQYYWYWTYWWLDIAMHVAGGVVLGLLVAIYGSQRFVLVLGGVLIIGIAWEVFEFVLGLSVTEPNFVSDTVVDLVMDLLGGSLAYGMIQLWPKSKSALTEVHDASPDQTSS